MRKRHRMNQQEFNVIADHDLAAWVLPLDVRADRRVFTLATPLVTLPDGCRIELDDLRAEPEAVRVMLARLPRPIWIEAAGVGMQVLAGLPAVGRKLGVDK